MSSAIHIDNDNFQGEVLQENVPVLVDFYAEWCGPCKMISPILEQVASSFSGKAKVCKVNIDQEKSLAMEYNVMSIPTLMLFHGGEKKEQVVGAVPKEDIEGLINKYV